MSIPVIINGNQYFIAVTGETNWGFETTNLLEALSFNPLTNKGDLSVYDGVMSIRLPVGLDGQVLTANAATPSGLLWGYAITSIGIEDDSTVPIYNTGPPITTASGTLTFTLKPENANKVFAGPVSGSATQPTFRTLTPQDLGAGGGTQYQLLGVGAGNTLEFYTLTTAGSGLTITDVPGTITFQNTGVISVDYQDLSTTPIFTTSPTTPSTGAVGLEMTLIAQDQNYFLAGSATTGPVQPTFRPIVASDLRGTGVAFTTTTGGNFGTLSPGGVIQVTCNAPPILTFQPTYECVIVGTCTGGSSAVSPNHVLTVICGTTTIATYALTYGQALTTFGFEINVYVTVQSTGTLTNYVTAGYSSNAFTGGSVGLAPTTFAAGSAGLGASFDFKLTLDSGATGYTTNVGAIVAHLIQ